MYQGHFLNTAYWEYVPSILFIMAIFRGQGFLFYFLLAAPHPFIAHSIRCGATLMLLPAGGIPARFPACLCFPLQPEQTPDGCFAQSRLLNFRSWPSTQGFLARHWLLFAASMSSGCGWPADFMPALRGEYACLRLADTSFRSPSLRVLLFHYCFWPKSQSFSAAKIVCGRERLDKP